MSRNTIAVGLLAVMSLCAVATADAQTAPQTAPKATAPKTATKARSALLDGIQSSVIKSIGAQAKTVEITPPDTVLTVVRVNSNQNASSHEGRNNEAKVIAGIASDAIAKTPEFAGVHTIKVQYIKRSAQDAVTTVDTIEFRKNATGAFEIHVS